MFYYSSFLTEAYRQAKTPLTQALKGSVGVIEKWKECVNDVNRKLGFALGALFVKETFGHEESTKQDAEAMIKHIRESFSRNVEDVQWMDAVIYFLSSVLIKFCLHAHTHTLSLGLSL